jgi:hypothetical protein
MQIKLEYDSEEEIEMLHEQLAYDSDNDFDSDEEMELAQERTRIHRRLEELGADEDDEDAHRDKVRRFFELEVDLPVQYTQPIPMVPTIQVDTTFYAPMPTGPWIQPEQTQPIVPAPIRPPPVPLVYALVEHHSGRQHYLPLNQVLYDKYLHECDIIDMKCHLDSLHAMAWLWRDSKIHA